jgi:succinate dehydrogenase/fumarate reductase flavoprotein subunit
MAYKEDISGGIPEYFWGYNRMMTVDGLFGAGDAVGGTPHAFSSGSFTEGRLSAKAACKYIDDGKAEGINISQKQIDNRKAEVYKPLETYTVGRNEISIYLQAAFADKRPSVNEPDENACGVPPTASPAPNKPSTVIMRL